MMLLSYTLTTLLLLTSAALILLILLHKGSGSGLSGMFGGASAQIGASSPIAQKNLTRLTISTGIVWAAATAAFGVLMHSVA